MDTVKRAVCVAAMLVGGVGTANAEARGVAGGEAVRVGMITEAAIVEASGMCCSRARSGVLWVANDSGNAAELFAVSTNGVLVGVVVVAGVRNRDWEDLASFVWEGAAYVLIADTGDNYAQYGDCVLTIVADPLPAEGEVRLPSSVNPAWTVRYRYPGGPRDCEAVAVDVTRGRILLLSKRDQPPVLYELPLRLPDGVEVAEACRVVEVNSVPAPTRRDLVADAFGAFRSQPTGMDLTDDGNTLVVLTYKHAYRYDRAVGEDWGVSICRTPAVLPMPDPATGIMRMREAIAINPGGTAVYVTSEGSPAPLYRIPLTNL